MNKYGMKNRGFSIGCQPMDGLIERQDANGKKGSNGRVFWDILVYDRELTDDEIRHYSLEKIEEPCCRLAERIRDTLYDMASIDDCPTIDEIQDGLKSPTESAYLLESLMDLYTADPNDEETKEIIYDLIQHMEGRD